MTRFFFVGTALSLFVWCAVSVQAPRTIDTMAHQAAVVQIAAR